jgi:NADPH:quinone reductase-like Zn-dependent oxidoreductase
MSPTRALYLDESGEIAIRQITETYTPTGAQDLVAVKYSAVNPADLRHYYMGMHSFVAGYEWMGPVVRAGPESGHKPGDVLFGYANYGHQRPLHRGAHQDFILADPLMTYKVPAAPAADEESWKQVVGWPVPAQTAADALFNVLGFAFPPLGKAVAGVDPKGKSILIVSPSPAALCLHFPLPFIHSLRSCSWCGFLIPESLKSLGYHNWLLGIKKSERF